MTERTTGATTEPMIEPRTESTTDRTIRGPSAPRPQGTTARELPGWSFLRSRRWLGYYALLLVFSIACVMLGNWQFDRRDQARAEIARIDSNYDAPAIPLREAVPALDAFDEDEHKWQTVEVVGEYFGEPYLARNRPGPGGVGADLIHPLRTSDGRVFFVDRGWIPFDADAADAADTTDAAGSIGSADPVDTSDTAEALPMPPEGTVRVEARLRAGEPAVAGRSSHGSTVGSIDLPEIARLAQVEDEAYTGAYGMLVREDPPGEHGLLPERPERDEGPHLSYALQWYVFIVIALCGVAYAARQEYRSLNAGSEAVKEQDRRRAERRRRRGDSDSDEEDALLDG